jgi:hypothetical protein
MVKLLIHDQLPFGTKRARISPVTDDNLQLCPCCKQSTEDQHHFLHGGQNPHHSSSWTELLTTFTESTRTPHHPFNVALLDCIDQWFLLNSSKLSSTDSPSTLTLTNSTSTPSTTIVLRQLYRSIYTLNTGTNPKEI